MRYNVYINNGIDYSDCRMGNDFRFIVDDFNQLTMHYISSKPSRVLSKDKDVVNKFRLKVLKRIIEYAEHLQQNI